MLDDNLVSGPLPGVLLPLTDFPDCPKPQKLLKLVIEVLGQPFLEQLSFFALSNLDSLPYIVMHLGQIIYPGISHIKAFVQSILIDPSLNHLVLQVFPLSVLLPSEAL